MFQRIARVVPGTGFAFGVLVLISFFVGPSTPSQHASNASWTHYYDVSSHRHREEISFFLIGLAGLCFLQFLGSLRGALARAEGEPSRITTAAVASGVAFIGIAISAHAVGTALSFSKSYYGSSLTVDADTARLLSSLSYLLYVMSLFAAAAMALATATVGLSKRAFPAWLGWLSVLATIAGVLGFFGVTGIVVLVWIMLLSLYMVWPRPTTAATPPPG